MEMYLDDSSSERKIIWHILKVGIPLELLKPLAPGFLASRGSTEGWSSGEVAAGGGRGSSTMVPSNSKAIFTGKESGLIEDLPKSIFDFFSPSPLYHLNLALQILPFVD